MLEFRYITVTVLGIALFYAQHRIIYILAICILYFFLLCVLTKKLGAIKTEDAPQLL